VCFLIVHAILLVIQLDELLNFVRKKDGIRDAHLCVDFPFCCGCPGVGNCCIIIDNATENRLCYLASRIEYCQVATSLNSTGKCKSSNVSTAEVRDINPLFTRQSFKQDNPLRNLIVLYVGCQVLHILFFTKLDLLIVLGPPMQ
jgi:hypothetical protein